MKNLKNILATGMFCGLVLLTGCETNYNKAKELLKNPKEVIVKPIQSGDKYWIYARNLKSQCNKFKHLDTTEIVDYIKYELNDGKELYEGKKVNFPEYNCE